MIVVENVDLRRFDHLERNFKWKKNNSIKISAALKWAKER